MQKIVTWHKIKFKIKNVHLKVNHPKKKDEKLTHLIVKFWIQNLSKILMWTFWNGRFFDHVIHVMTPYDVQNDE